MAQTARESGGLDSENLMAVLVARGFVRRYERRTRDKARQCLRGLFRLQIIDHTKTLPIRRACKTVLTQALIDQTLQIDIRQCNRALERKTLGLAHDHTVFSNQTVSGVHHIRRGLPSTCRGVGISGKASA